MTNGWNPKLNFLGEVCSGAGELYYGDRKLAEPCQYPNWFDNDTIIFIGSGDFLYVIDKNGTELQKLSDTKFSLLVASNFSYVGLSVPNIYIDGQFIEEGKAPSISKSGNAKCHAHPYFPDNVEVIVNGVVVGTGLVFETSVLDYAVCWSVAEGNNRVVYGRKSGVTSKLSLTNWERPVLVDVNGSAWVCSRLHDDTLNVYPWGEKFGYHFNISCWGQDALFINNKIRVVYSNGSGVFGQLDVDLTKPRVDLTLTNPTDPTDPDPEPEPDMAPNEEATVKEQLRAHPEVDVLDDEERGKILDYVIEDLNHGPWGRKSKNDEGTDLNTDVLGYKFSDGKIEWIDVLLGRDPNPSDPDRGKFSSWTTDGKKWNDGDNGFWVPAGEVDTDPDDPDDPDEPDNPVNVNKDDVRDGSNEIIRFYNEPDGLNRAARGIPSPIDVHDQACWDWVALYTTHLAHGKSMDEALKLVIDQIKTFPEYKEQHPNG